MTDAELAQVCKALSVIIRDEVRKATDAVPDHESRLLKLELREPAPGPAGPPGPPGPPGKDGLTMEHKGAWADSATYEPGQHVVHKNSYWRCNEATTKKPGDGSKAWTLVAKAGDFDHGAR